MAERNNILVIGATGKQGGAVVKALLRLPSSDRPLHVLAVTRNPESAGAKALIAAHADQVSLITGDLKNSKAILATQSKGSIGAAFLVTLPGANEEKTGKDFIDAAIDHDVAHIVFSSVDRGGNEKSWTNPTDIPHFITKHKVELYLREQTEGKPQTYTILRPTAFMDNLNPSAFGGIIMSTWKIALAPTTRLQHIAVRDVGVFAARALTEPRDRWAGRAVGLAGDQMTLTEAKQRFHDVTGKDLPESWGILARLLMFAVADVGKMFAWFEREGYGIDIEAVRKEAGDQGLWDFDTWIKEGSKWEQ